MKKVFISFLAVVSLASCGKETIIKEVLVTTPVTEAPVQTTLTTEAPKLNKYDQYLADLYDFSAQARSWDEALLLQFGKTVCDALDNGARLNAIVDVLSEYSSGSYDDELFAGVILYSVKYICPEHLASVQAQL